jgi:uncharacterized protein YjbJ (UPF0337 family)
MEWHEIESRWEHIKGKVKEKWDKLTDNDLAAIQGKRHELVNRIKHIYGVAKEDVEKQIEEFRVSLKKEKDHKKGCVENNEQKKCKNLLDKAETKMPETKNKVG